MKQKIIRNIVIGAVISAAGFYLAFRNIPFTELLFYLASINYLWMAPAIVIILVSFILRAFRWQIILNSTFRIKFWQAYHPLMIGFMVNCILPGRAGEIIRPAIIKKEGVDNQGLIVITIAESAHDLVAVELRVILEVHVEIAVVSRMFRSLRP